jgi:hypothetical protein
MTLVTERFSPTWWLHFTVPQPEVDVSTSSRVYLVATQFDFH